jgi:hypothetical protein
VRAISLWSAQIRHSPSFFYCFPAVICLLSCNLILNLPWPTMANIIFVLTSHLWSPELGSSRSLHLEVAIEKYPATLSVSLPACCFPFLCPRFLYPNLRRDRSLLTTGRICSRVDYLSLFNRLHVYSKSRMQLSTPPQLEPRCSLAFNYAQCFDSKSKEIGTQVR